MAVRIEQPGKDPIDIHHRMGWDASQQPVTLENKRVSAASVKSWHWKVHQADLADT